MAQQVNATIQIVDLDEGAGADQYFDYGQGVGGRSLCWTTPTNNHRKNHNHRTSNIGTGAPNNENAECSNYSPPLA